MPLELDQDLLEFEGAGVAHHDRRERHEPGRHRRSRRGEVHRRHDHGWQRRRRDNASSGQGGAFRVQPLGGSAQADRTSLATRPRTMAARCRTRELPLFESTATGNRSSGLAGGIYSLRLEMTAAANRELDGQRQHRAAPRPGRRGLLRRRVAAGARDDRGELGEQRGGSVRRQRSERGVGDSGGGERRPRVWPRGPLRRGSQPGRRHDLRVRRGRPSGRRRPSRPVRELRRPAQTHALYTGSPALDGGDADECPAEDQRLIERLPTDRVTSAPTRGASRRSRSTRSGTRRNAYCTLEPRGCTLREAVTATDEDTVVTLPARGLCADQRPPAARRRALGRGGGGAHDVDHSLHHPRRDRGLRSRIALWRQRVRRRRRAGRSGRRDLRRAVGRPRPQRQHRRVQPGDDRRRDLQRGEPHGGAQQRRQQRRLRRDAARRRPRDRRRHRDADRHDH